jgi:peroxiredoxin Q/BCP
MAMIWIVALVVVVLLAVLGLPRFRSGPSPAIGGVAPGFALANQDGALVSLADFRGRWVVLYFYPKDKTPG